MCTRRVVVCNNSLPFQMARRLMASFHEIIVLYRYLRSRLPKTSRPFPLIILIPILYDPYICRRCGADGVARTAVAVRTVVDSEFWSFILQNLNGKNQSGTQLLGLYDTLLSPQSSPAGQQRQRDDSLCFQYSTGWFLPLFKYRLSFLSANYWFCPASLYTYYLTWYQSTYITYKMAVTFVLVCHRHRQLQF